LAEEEAAQVLQRYYRKWKTLKQNSLEGKGSKVPGSPDAEWDAPFRLVETKLRDSLIGKKAKAKNGLDMGAYRKEMIRQGLASQKFQNEQRDARIRRGWGETIRSIGSQPDPSAQDRKLSKFGKHFLPEKQPTVVGSISPPSDPPEARNGTGAGDGNSLQLTLGNIKVANRNVKVKSLKIQVSDSGQMDFRKLLRKTGNCPTDSNSQ